MPIASPIINTRVWSARAPGDVRKKYASVIWKRERDVMIVFPDMSAMMFTSAPRREREGEKVGEVGWLLFAFMRFHELTRYKNGHADSGSTKASWRAWD